MGVKGLSTFISNNERRYLQDFKLHDCYIIIDGSSLTYQIYAKFSSRAHCAFGGDYDRFAQYIRDFFDLLSKCNVKPIVLFDGGYAPRKVGTVIKRMSQRLIAIRHLQPSCTNSSVIFPLLMKNVAKEVLQEMGIPFVQCDFEADQEIASLARKYKCPVLSNDSDFYIFDVDYIPIPTLEFEATPLNFVMGQPNEQFCICCKLYKVEYFLNWFGGLEKSMLPLLAALLGNDYVKMTVFKKFYSQFKLPKNKQNPLQKKIKRLIEWLRHETFDSAVDRILARMKQVRHKRVKDGIRASVKAYTEINTTVEKYLPLEFTSMANGSEGASKTIGLNAGDHDMSEANGTKKEEDDQEMDVDNEEDNGNASDDECSSSENEDDDSETEFRDDVDAKTTNRRIKIPDWLIENYHKGLIDPCVFDILRLRKYFSLPQAEDMLYKCSHASSLPLLKMISKSLLNDNFESISLWMRNNTGSIQRFLLHLTNTRKLFDVESIVNSSVENRRSILLDALGVSSNFQIDSFPPEWKLYICAIIFWMKNTPEPLITDNNLFSLLMSIVTLSLIDKHVGFHRKKITFLKKYGKLQKKIINNIENSVSKDVSNEDILVDDSVGKENSNVVMSDCETVQQIFSSIDADECLAVFDSFYQFHQLDDNLKRNRKYFSTRAVHSFGQFQSCLHHVLILNSLLGFPFDQPVISRLYSGTFVYNLCVALSRSKGAFSHIQMLLKNSPNILKLVESMFSIITSQVPVAIENLKIKKSKNKRRKKSGNADEISEEEVEIVEEDKPVDNDYVDDNNAFSMLSTM